MKFTLSQEIVDAFVREAKNRPVEAVLFGSPILREREDGEDQSLLATWAWAVSQTTGEDGDTDGTDSPTESFDFLSDFWSVPKMGNLQNAFKNATRVLPGGWVVTGFIVGPEYDALQRSLELRDACQKWNPNCQFSTQLILQSIAPSFDEGTPEYLAHCLDGEAETLDECEPTKCPLRILPMKEMMRDMRLFRIRGSLPLTYCVNENYTQTTLWEEAEYLKNRVLSNSSAFRVEHCPDVLLRSSLKESAEELDDRNVRTIWKEVLREREEQEEVVAKQQESNFDCSLDLRLVFVLGEEASYNEFVIHAPTVKQETCYGTGVSVDIEVDCLAVIPLDTLTMMLLPILRHSVAYQIKRAVHWLGKAAKAKIEPRLVQSLQPVHVQAGSLGFPVSLLLPVGVDENDASLVTYRKSLHEAFLIPQDRPTFRLGNKYLFFDDLREIGKLLNPHEAVPNTESASVSDGTGIACVQGRYLYYHYMQDRINDDGWGCAYRSLQTLASWFRLQGYSNTPVPSHREIQQCLVDIGDKEQRFVGSKMWIGSSEVGYVLENFFGVMHKISHARSGADMATKGRELKMHFETQGTPVMIGGGDLAHTILGVDFNEETGDVRFLILDPHYTGDENLKVITSKGWCAWKNMSFWKPNVFYNMCLPQRPDGVL